MKLIQQIFGKYSILLSMAILMALPVLTAAQGQIAFLTNRGAGYDFEIYKMNGDGSNEVNLTNTPGNDLDPAFSKYGSRIVFASARDGNYEIYSMKHDGSEVVRLTNNVAEDREPAFNPDMSKIAFVSNRDGNREIYSMNVDGTGVQRLTWNSDADTQPIYSPDGTKIIFVSEHDGNLEIYSMSTLGWMPTNLTNNPFDDWDPSFKSDGSRIAFTSTRDPGVEFYEMHADGTNVIRMTDTPTYSADPTYSPDGTKIAFVFLTSSFYEIFMTDLTGGPAVALTASAIEGEANMQPVWAPKPRNFRALSFSEFLSPDYDPGVVEAGVGAAIDFTLEGYYGDNIYRSAPTSQRINCSTGRPTGGVETISRTQPDVVYSSLLEHYSTTWLTKTAWKGTCRRLSLNMVDGETHQADFYFR